jgi:hypothetical protein
MLMLHGSAFLTGIAQSGPRGEDRLVSANWGMLSAARRAGDGAFMLRGMLSLDPLTIRRGFYPLLFQTGEEHDGVPIVDGQHPHDFFMELAAAYARRVTPGASLLLYAALVGDPALGPAAFPHRSSSAENPTAVLGHHLQDSTHIAADVLTAGWDSGPWRLEGSGFHGQEPDDHRWDIEQGPIDSWSGRLSFRPAGDWVAQVSRGRLRDPEAHEPGDVTRTTASLLFGRKIEDGGVDLGLVWGRNDREGGLRLNSYLAEGAWKFRERHFLFGRFERLDRDELFADDPAQEAAFASAGIASFTIDALTVGYTRNLGAPRRLETGLGADATIYRFPSELDPFYGASPKAFHLFLRLRGHASSPTASMPGHEGHH